MLNVTLIKKKEGKNEKKKAIKYRQNNEIIRKEISFCVKWG